DNGGEAARHTQLRDIYGILTFFCDSYKSWQKGGVENINGLIRQYLPRKTNLDTITDREIYDIQEQLNNRPRKSLNYLTPNEIIQRFLSNNNSRPGL
ncbi:IS30 family transposase, partial [Patescibacteria group bacterium]|nr:IS30 family transposase [Patescibacteria group bacterium]MBU1721545.1 IS30 family transposase [Patescibacteria group bacterium]MBU1901550.1 IS30 family transposase [Patescibacteria group bacterium]